MMRNDNKKFDTALIRDLAVLLDETNLSEIELEQGDTRTHSRACQTRDTRALALAGQYVPNEDMLFEDC